jgi:hypothetical protein
MSTFKPKDKSAEKKQKEEKNETENRTRAAVDELLKHSYQLEYPKDTAENSNKLEQPINVKTDNITAPIAVLDQSTDDTNSIDN